LEFFLADVVLEGVNFKEFFWLQRRVFLDEFSEVFSLSKNSFQFEQSFVDSMFHEITPISVSAFAMSLPVSMSFML
jgi:hypothetical protein